VPKDFGDKKLTWTLSANGKTTSIPVNLNTLWEVSPFTEASNNTPPFLGFSESGPFVQGPIGTGTSMVASHAEPAALNAWVADDAKPPVAGLRPRTPPVMPGWS